MKSYELDEAVRNKILKDFYLMVASLNNVSEVEKFLKDLLTPSESVMIARRIQIAKMLLEGALHEEIRRKLGVGFSTINQVDRWLNNGFGGYKLALKKLKKGAMPKFQQPQNIPMTFDWLRKRYPAHYLLINLLMKNK